MKAEDVVWICNECGTYVNDSDVERLYIGGKGLPVTCPDIECQGHLTQYEKVKDE